jgi:Zn-dependent membrane protease YugP
MIYALGGLIFLALIYGPQLWVRYILQKHHRIIDNMPGTGGELAQHLVDRFELAGVTVEEGKSGQDHYNTASQTVSLSPEVFHNRSLSAVAVAAHEVGHAIQFSRDEPVSQLRGKYLGRAATIQKAGIFILMSLPVVAVIFRIPHVLLLTAAVGILTMAASVLMYVAILPEEYDASFNKALPILEEGYVPEDQLPAVRQILKACALTYVAGALADILRLWRWLVLIR